MKKIILAVACTACMAIAAVAQKKSPPPPPPPPPSPPTVTVTEPEAPVIEKYNEDVDAFLKQNPSVKRIAWKKEHVIALIMKDKTVKTYNLEVEKMKKAFTEAFGEAPVPPPPPPLPPVITKE